jgi:hypothetical protein
MWTETDSGKQLMHNLVVYFDGTGSEVNFINGQLSQLEEFGTTRVCTIHVANLMIAEIETIDLPEAFVQATTYLAARGVDLVDVQGRLNRSVNGHQKRSMTMMLDAPSCLSDVTLEASLKAECLSSSARVQVRQIGKGESGYQQMLMEFTPVHTEMSSMPLMADSTNPLLRLTVTGRNRCGLLAEALRSLEDSQSQTISFHGDRAGYKDSQGDALGRVSILFECKDRKSLSRSIKTVAELGRVRLDEYRVAKPVVLNFKSCGLPTLSSMHRMLTSDRFEILNVVGDWIVDHAGLKGSHSINLVVARA